MGFVNFRDAIRKNFEEMSKNSSRMFEVEIDKEKIWDIYLSSFSSAANPIYRVRTEHDCTCCRRNIR